MLKISSTICLVFALQFLANAQYPDSIPFVFTPYNNIYVESLLNETDSLKLMFHTGASGVGITEAALERLSSKQNTTSLESKTWGGSGTLQYFKGNRVQIGNNHWDSLTVWVGKHSGHLTDGKFGPNLFKDKLIELDYDNNRFVIHATAPSKQVLKSYQRLKINRKNGLISIRGALQIGKKKFRNKFMIHTGYGGTLLLDDKFANKHQLGSQLEIISESELKDSYGNVLVTKKAILPHFEIGDSEFKELPVSFFDGALGRQKISVIGSGLFKRYNAIFDLKKGYVYLKANTSMELPFDNA